MLASVSVSFPDCGHLYLGDHIIAVSPEPGTGVGRNRCSANKQQIEILVEPLLCAQHYGEYRGLVISSNVCPGGKPGVANRVEQCEERVGT